MKAVAEEKKYFIGLLSWNTFVSLQPFLSDNDMPYWRIVFSPQIISNVTLQSTISVEESLFAAQLSPPELPLHLQQVSLVGEGDHGVRHHLLQQLLPHVAKGFILHLLEVFLNKKQIQKPVIII